MIRSVIFIVRVAMLAAVMTTVALAAPLGSASDDKYGKGVSLTEATPIKALYETPDKFVGKTIRIDGVVTAVCEEMGCWMALAASATSGDIVRLKVDHDGGIVFPISAKGKTASAEGVFEKTASTDKFPFQIKATGAIVR